MDSSVIFLERVNVTRPSLVENPSNKNPKNQPLPRSPLMNSGCPFTKFITFLNAI